MYRVKGSHKTSSYGYFNEVYNKLEEAEKAVADMSDYNLIK